jgi:hypothetical protein
MTGIAINLCQASFRGGSPKKDASAEAVSKNDGIRHNLSSHQGQNLERVRFSRLLTVAFLAVGATGPSEPLPETGRDWRCLNSAAVSCTAEMVRWRRRRKACPCLACRLDLSCSIGAVNLTASMEQKFTTKFCQTCQMPFIPLTRRGETEKSLGGPQCRWDTGHTHREEPPDWHVSSLVAG